MNRINGQEIIEKKVCNAKIVGATPNFSAYFASFVSSGLGGAIAFASVIGAFKKMLGGLWVGGNVYLTSASVIFEPNKLNAALQSNVDAVEIPLKDIVNIKREFGVLTGIACINTDSGSLKIRCYNASGFIERINERIL